MIREIWTNDQKSLERTRRTIGKVGNKRTVEFGKDWKEMEIRVKGKENRANMYTPTDIAELSNRGGYRNRVENE